MSQGALLCGPFARMSIVHGRPGRCRPAEPTLLRSGFCQAFLSACAQGATSVAWLACKGAQTSTPITCAGLSAVTCSRYTPSTRAGPAATQRGPNAATRPRLSAATCGRLRTVAGSLSIAATNRRFSSTACARFVGVACHWLLTARSIRLVATAGGLIAATCGQVAGSRHLPEVRPREWSHRNTM